MLSLGEAGWRVHRTLLNVFLGGGSNFLQFYNYFKIKIKKIFKPARSSTLPTWTAVFPPPLYWGSLRLLRHLALPPLWNAVLLCPLWCGASQITFPPIFIFYALMASVFRNLHPGSVSRSLHALHGYNLVYFYHFLSQVPTVCLIFPLSVLKTQMLADPTCLALLNPASLSLKLNTSSSQNESLIPSSILHLRKWNQSSLRGWQLNGGITCPHPSQTVTSHDLTILPPEIFASVFPSRFSHRCLTAWFSVQN